MSNTFNVGDRVKLVSGGPEMAVEETGFAGKADDVLCVWMDKSTRKTDVFKVATLRKVEPSKVVGGWVSRGKSGRVLD